MKQRDSDIFEMSKRIPNPDSIQDFFTEDENPFMNSPAKQENMRRLNDYDFNILKDGAYKDIADDVFKLEYKISRTEEEIKNIEAQISAAEEINDIDRITSLSNKLYAIKDDYKTLLAIYNDKTISAKITDSFSNFVEKTVGINFSGIKSNISDLCDSILAKMPKGISSIFKIKKSLSVLENINKSVDELVTMTIPYGENIDKYHQLSKYILKANSIQSEIAGYLKKNA